jgi:HTH-type transcriptional regulator / antitoxin HigA
MLNTTEIRGKRTVKKLDDAVYARLLAATLPKRIETKAENKKYLALLEELLAKGDKRTIEERNLTQLFAVLISEFEQRCYKPANFTPHELLLSLMEENGLRQRDLLPIFGSRSLISAVINGKRAISKKHAKALAEHFRLRADAFL